MRPTHRAALGAATLLLSGFVAGCGGSAADHGSMSGMTAASSAAAAGQSANDADIAFASGMVPHHEQAVTMAEQALESGASAEVLALATAIRDAQAPEIETMTGWLEAWGHPTSGGHDMSDMSAHDMGMMTDAEMQQMSEASGPAFDRLWLDMMIRHHQGAVTMSQAQLRDGQSGEVTMLAQQIIDSQQAEIAQMQGLLAAME